MGGCTAHLHQLHFQGFEDGSEAGATAIAAVDTNFSRDVDTVFGMRFEVEESANCSSMNNQFHLQRNLGGAGWLDVTTSSAVAQLVDSANLTDAEATTNRIAGSAKGFVAGEVDEEGTTANITLQNQHTEMHFVVQIVGADVNDQDTIQFRAISGASPLDEYHQTPTVTAVKGGQTTPQALPATAIGVATLSRTATYKRTLAPVAVGAASLASTATFRRTLSATVTGVAVLTAKPVFKQVLTAVANGVAGLSTRLVTIVQLAATAAATATLATTATFRRTLAATATGVAAFSTVATFKRTLAATALGVAALATKLTFKQALAAVASGIATLSSRSVVTVQLAATAIAGAVFVTTATFRRTLSATATGIASLMNDSQGEEGGTSTWLVPSRRADQHALLAGLVAKTASRKSRLGKLYEDD